MFELDDLEKDWTWTRPFDLIMSRSNAGCFKNMEDFMKQAYEYVEPPLQIARLSTLVYQGNRTNWLDQEPRAGWLPRAAGLLPPIRMRRRHNDS